jgi:hypothetical protein
MRYVLVPALIALLGASDVVAAGQGLLGRGATDTMRACCGDGCRCGPEAPCRAAAPDPVPAPAKIANSSEVQLPRAAAGTVAVATRFAPVPQGARRPLHFADGLAGPAAADRPLFLLESALLL